MKNVFLIIGIAILQVGCTSNATTLKRAPLLTFAELDAEITISRERISDPAGKFTDINDIVATQRAMHLEK